MEVGPPSLEALRVAKFAHALGVRLLGIRRDVALRWFRPSAWDRERGVQGKAASDHGAIYVRRADHAPEFLVEVVLHELKHVERGAAFNTPAQEQTCRECGRKWSRAVFAAGRVTDWDADRVTLIRESHPGHVHPPLKCRTGDVALGQQNHRAWEFRAGAWSELLT